LGTDLIGHRAESIPEGLRNCRVAADSADDLLEDGAHDGSD